MLTHAERSLCRIGFGLWLGTVAVNSLFGYTLGGEKWPDGVVTMHLQLGVPSNGATLGDGSTSWNAVAENALWQWNLHLGRLQFSIVRNSAAQVGLGNRINNVFWSDSVYGDSWGSNTVGITKYRFIGSTMSEADVIFNNTRSWNAWPSGQNSRTSPDLTAVALHEFGHVLGLDHPDQAGQRVSAIMNSASGAGSPNALLSDDIAGGQALYGIPPPRIAAQPRSITATIGYDATFNVTAVGSNLSYQWLFNDAPLSGATTSQLMLRGVTATNAGIYSVTIAGSNGSITSDAARLVTARPYTASVIAGRAGQRGTINGAASTSGFSELRGIAADDYGNLFVADSVLIRKLAPDGTVSTLATLPRPIWHIAADSAGNIFATGGLAGFGFTESERLITKVTSDGKVSILAGSLNSSGTADGTGSQARFTFPRGITVDEAGNIYVIDGDSRGFNSRIRKISPAGMVTTLEDALGSPVLFYAAINICVDNRGILFVDDRLPAGKGTVWKVTSEGIVSALLSTSYEPLGGLATDRGGNLYLVGSYVSLVNDRGERRPLAGFPAVGNYLGPLDGAGIAARVLGNSIAVDKAGNFYTTDAIYHVIQKGTAPAEDSGFAGSRISNISIRTAAGAGSQTLIVGFVVGGAGTNGSKPLLIRGIGPALSQFGVTGILSDPQLQVFNGSSLIATNDDWGGRLGLSNSFSQIGAFALPASSKDAALTTTLDNGDYSVQIAGANGATGVVLAEIYDMTTSSTVVASTPRLVNVSARAQVDTGAGVLIAGFTIGGTGSKSILIRAIGPALGQFGVTGVLADPQIQLFQGSVTIASNNDWSGTNALATAFTQVGAFALPANSRDSALQVTLQPGSYSAQVSGVGNTTGVALVEVYELP